MMKPILSAIFLLMLLSCSEPKKETAPVSADDNAYAEYFSKAHQLKISYPKGWDTTKKSERMIAIIVEPKTSKEDPFKENIVLYKTQLPEKLSPDSVLKLAIATMPQQFPGARFIASGTGKNAMHKEYAVLQMIINQHGVNIFSSAYYFPTGQNFFVLNIGYNSTDSVKYKPICDQVFNSLTFD